MKWKERTRTKERMRARRTTASEKKKILQSTWQRKNVHPNHLEHEPTITEKYTKPTMSLLQFLVSLVVFSFSRAVRKKTELRFWCAVARGGGGGGYFFFALSWYLSSFGILGPRYWSFVVSIFMSNLVFAEPIINEAPKSPPTTSKNKCIQRPKDKTIDGGQSRVGVSKLDREEKKTGKNKQPKRIFAKCTQNRISLIVNGNSSHIKCMENRHVHKYGTHSYTYTQKQMQNACKNK